MKLRKHAGVAIAAALCGILGVAFGRSLLEGQPAAAAADYTSIGVADTGSINIPTAILMDYRAFDTLGEATVIFASVAVVALILGKPRFYRPDRTLSLLSRRALVYLLPVFVLFPAYIIANGHRSPGGGFQGGVSLAVLVILLHVAFGRGFALQRVPLRLLGLAEYLSAIAFMAVGLIGLLRGSALLANGGAGIPLGVPGTLLSGGLIPLLNLIVGCKIAAGLSAIYCYLAGHNPDSIKSPKTTP